MKTFKKRKAVAVTEKAQKISFAGDLGLRDADTLRELLLDALRARSVVEVDCGDLTDIDMSIVQILIAADKMANGCNRTLRVFARSEGPLADALSRAGLHSRSQAAPFDVHWDRSNAAT